MNTTEHLLACLAEECDEVGQRCMKALRFGLEEVQPGQPLNNAERIAQECTDLLGAMKYLEDYGLIKVDRSQGALVKKQLRIDEYMKRARETGALT